MTPNQERLVSLLLGSFPTFQSGDAEAALAAYALVIRNADERDVEPGVMILINGEYPGHDGRFAPTAPQLASGIRIARDRRLESERFRRLALPPPAEPEVSAEERERVKAGFERLVADMAAKARTDDAVADQRYRDRLRQTNAAMAPDMTEAAMLKRLGYTVGNDGEEFAA